MKNLWVKPLCESMLKGLLSTNEILLYYVLYELFVVSFRSFLAFSPFVFLLPVSDFLGHFVLVFFIDMCNVYADLQ